MFLKAFAVATIAVLWDAGMVEDGKLEKDVC